MQTWLACSMYAALAFAAAGGSSATGGSKQPRLKDRYAGVNGVKLHYVSAGKGRVILFAHGFPEFWYEWKNQLIEFGRDHHAVAPDLRGYNLSAKPVDIDAYRIQELVADLRALAESLGTKRFVLVGHDWGGAVAWAFAATHPEMLERLIIINAPHPAVFQRELRADPAQQKASQYMLLFRSPQAEQVLAANNYAALVEGVLGDGLRKGYFTEDDKRAYLEAWSQPGALTGGLNYYRAARIGPPTGQAGEFVTDGAFDPAAFAIKVPTLVIWGEKDTALMIGNLDGLDKYVPNLTIARIPDAGHWVVHEQPGHVNRLIREFLERKTTK